MSAVYPTKDGTFELLDDLQEEGRCRFVKRRPKEELEAIVVAVWRERDRPRAQDIQRTATIAAAQLEKSVQEPSDEMNNVAAGKRIARNTARSKTSNRVTILKAPGRRDQPPITGPAKNAQSLKQKEIGSNTIPPTFEQRVEDLPIVLYVPGNHGKIHYPSIEQLPLKAHAELKRRLDKHRNGSLYKTYAYQRLVNNPAFYEDRPYCACDQIARGLRPRENGRPVKAQDFEQGGKLGLRADDRCIRDGIPCTHIIKQDGEYVLCFVPLPKNVQKSVNWKELGFWVQE